MAYGLTHKSTQQLAKSLADILDIDYTTICNALHQITKDEIARIAKNELRSDT